MSGISPTRKSSTSTVNWAKLRKSSSTNERQRLIRGKYLCLITGAGGGFGRAIANLTFQDQGIFPLAMAGSKVVLIDKDEEGLRETSGKKMRQFLKHRKIEVELITTDLSDLDKTKEFVDELSEKCDKDYEHVILIHCATSLADVSKKFVELDDVKTIHDFWSLNLTSTVFVTSQICKIFRSSKTTLVFTANNDLVGSAPYLGLNGMTSCAILLFAETFAKENPATHVLHFTPCRMDTSTTKTLNEQCGNEEIREKIATSYELKDLHAPGDSAKKITKILEEATFATGELLKIDAEKDNNNI